jgi:mono/diheme cytochrome c family protein
MKWLLGLGLVLSLAAADQAMLEKGKAEEKRACVACHGLRIVHVQRLSRAQWDRELTKMAGWGSPIKDREALLEYLVANYGDDKPVAPLPRSEDASHQKR